MRDPTFKTPAGLPASQAADHTTSLSTTPRAGRDRPSLFLRLIAWVLMVTISTSSLAQAVGPLARGGYGQPYTGFTKNGTLVQGGQVVGNKDNLGSVGVELAHAGVGCAAGAVRSDSSAGCGAGAVGAVVGHLGAGWVDSANGYTLSDEELAFYGKTIGGVGAALVGSGDKVQENFDIGQGTADNAVVNNYLSTRQLTIALEKIDECQSGCEVLKKSLQRNTQQGGEQNTIGRLEDLCKANPQGCLSTVQDIGTALKELQKPETRALLGDAGTNALIQRQTSDLGKAVEALQWGADHLESSQAIARAAVGVGLTAAGGGLALSLGRAVMAACGSGVSSPACVGLTTELAVGAMETAGGVPTVGLTAASLTATANQLAKTAATATDAAQVVKEVRLVRAEVAAGRNGATSADFVLPGMNRPVRPINSDFPPNQAVVDAANSPQMQALVKNIRCIDCSEIAPKLLQAAGGKGQILEVQPTNRGSLKVFENGRLEPNQSYHQVYTDGKYVYGPRLSSRPIPKGDWEQHIHNINPGGVKISSDLKGLQ